MKVLGRGGHDGLLPHQSVANTKPRWEDATKAWYNKKPVVQHLRVFGCVAYMKVMHSHLAKLDPRGLKVVFIGYKPGSKAYMLYDPTGGRAHVSHDMTESDQKQNKFTVEYLVTEQGEGGAQHQSLSPPPVAAPGTPTPTPIATLAEPLKPVEFATDKRQQCWILQS